MDMDRTKKKISEAQKALWRDPAVREKRLAAMAEGRAKLMADPERVAAMKEKMRLASQKQWQARRRHAESKPAVRAPETRPSFWRRIFGGGQAQQAA